MIISCWITLGKVFDDNYGAEDVKLNQPPLAPPHPLKINATQNRYVIVLKEE